MPFKDVKCYPTMTKDRPETKLNAQPAAAHAATDRPKQQPNRAGPRPRETMAREPEAAKKLQLLWEVVTVSRLHEALMACKVSG